MPDLRRAAMNVAIKLRFPPETSQDLHRINPGTCAYEETGDVFASSDIYPGLALDTESNFDPKFEHTHFERVTTRLAAALAE